MDSVVVNEIEDSIRQAKKIKLQNADGFTIGIYKDFRNLNIDTLMYMIDHYGFEKHDTSTSWDNEIYLTSQLSIKENIRIRLTSESWKINVLPDDVKTAINL